MVLFKVPDIRLFWSNDERFLNQFSDGKISKFEPYSKYESCYKDISLFLNDKFNYNELCNIAREADKDSMIESIELIDTFVKGNLTSHCYRITYRSMDRTLTNYEIDLIQNQIRDSLAKELGVTIR